MKNHILVKSLLFSLLVGMACFFSFKGHAADLHNVQTIGQKNRNQAVGQGLQVGDSLYVKGVTVLKTIHTYHSDSILCMDGNGEVYIDTSGLSISIDSFTTNHLRVSDTAKISKLILYPVATSDTRTSLSIDSVNGVVVLDTNCRPTCSQMGIAIHDSLLISWIRKSTPNLIGYWGADSVFKSNANFQFVNTSGPPGGVPQLSVYNSTYGVGAITTNALYLDNQSGGTQEIVCNSGLLTNISYTIGTNSTGTIIMVNSVNATGSEPSSPYQGQIIFNSTTNKLNFWNGTAWAIITSTP